MFSSRQNRWLKHRKPKTYGEYERQKAARDEMIRLVFANHDLECPRAVELIRSYTGEYTVIQEKALDELQQAFDYLYVKRNAPVLQIKVKEEIKVQQQSKISEFMDRLIRLLCRLRILRKHQNSELKGTALEKNHFRVWTNEMTTVPMWGSHLERILFLCGSLSNCYDVCIPRFLEQLGSRIIHQLKQSELLIFDETPDQANVSFIRCHIEIEGGNQLEEAIISKASISELLFLMRDWLESLRVTLVPKESVVWLIKIHEFFRDNYKGCVLQRPEEDTPKINFYSTIDSLPSLDTPQECYISHTGFPEVEIKIPEYPKKPMGELLQLLRCLLLSLPQAHQHLLIYLFRWCNDVADWKTRSKGTTTHERAELLERFGRYFGKAMVGKVQINTKKLPGTTFLTIQEDILTLMLIFYEKIVVYDEVKQ